jgi:CRP/FNR family transcriptional regulator
MNTPAEYLAATLHIMPEHPGLNNLARHASINHYKAGTKLFATGDACDDFVMITKGTARVQISTRTGREMILFRLNAGDICALTTSCLLTDSPYYAEGISETELDILAIPSSVFQQTLKSDPDIFIPLLGNYARRIGELTNIIDRLMSRDLDTELATFLLTRADTDLTVALSHQKIAKEIGTSREVISRKLKALEKAGVVKLGRGKIWLKNTDRLGREL